MLHLGTHCISKLWRCDHSVNCPDRSDEDPNHCKSHIRSDRTDGECTEYEFACNSGKLVYKLKQGLELENSFYKVEQILIHDYI